ncbi:MAG: diguanylate cyclase [Gammaproteobacteria bacterium]|nr:diguanylate cyclase [Gammaproteobacteria bacterium]
MKLRAKVLLILATAWAVIFMTLYFASKAILTAKFSRLEIQQVDSNLGRATLAFRDMQHALTLLSNDWGQWDDAYIFMRNKNSNFIKANFEANTFSNAKMNVIFIYDTKGKLFFGKYYDLVNKQFASIPDDLLSNIQSTHILSKLNESNTNKVGLIKTSKGYLILSVSSILKSDGTGPIAGAILMGYFLDKGHIEKLIKAVRLPMTFYYFPVDYSKNQVVNKAYRNTSNNQIYISPSNKKIISGFAPILDVNQHPIAMLRIYDSRTLYNEGIKTIKYYLLTILMLGFGVALLIWYLLKVYVLDRLISVSQQVININKEAQFSKRITISGKDELNQMVDALNLLMELIELTQDQLSSRLSQRTEKLERLAHLNKNLFSVINQQKATEFKMRKDEKTLRQMAYYDGLTGLPNRMFFNEMLEKTIKRAENTGVGFVIMFLDSNKFKHINDTYGHDMGDIFLKHVANRLKLVVKDSDVAARMAGDEFIILINNVKEKVIIDLIAEKILASVSVPMVEKDVTISTSFSIGISIYPEDGETVETLEHSADVAMYYAKRQGNNSYRYASEVEKEVE